MADIRIKCMASGQVGQKEKYYFYAESRVIIYLFVFCFFIVLIAGWRFVFIGNICVVRNGNIL